MALVVHGLAVRKDSPSCGAQPCIRFNLRVLTQVSNIQIEGYREAVHTTRLAKL